MLKTITLNDYPIVYLDELEGDSEIVFVDPQVVIIDALRELKFVPLNSKENPCLSAPPLTSPGP